MPKFHGAIGYVETRKTAPGVFEEIETERDYYGDVERVISRLSGVSTLNDNLALNNSISVIADAYAYEHFSAIRYVVWHGTKWKISSVEVRRPRLVLSIGEVYKG